MLAFIIRRLLQAIVVMLTVALIAFTLFRFVGDPINMMVGIETTAEERAKLRSSSASTTRFRSSSRASSATRRGSISAIRTSSRHRSST